MRIVVSSVVLYACMCTTSLASAGDRTYLSGSRYASPSAYAERMGNQATYTPSYSGNPRRLYEFTPTAEYAPPPPMQAYNNPSYNNTYVPPSPVQDSVPAPMTAQAPAYAPPPQIEASAAPAPITPPTYAPSPVSAPPPPAAQTFNSSAPNTAAPPPPSSVPAPVLTPGASHAEPYSTYGVKSSSSKQTANQSGWFPLASSGTGFKASLGLGAGGQNKYEGSGDYRALPIPYVDLSYNDLIFFNTLQGLGANIYRGDNFQFTAALGYRLGRRAADTKMGTYGNIDMAFEGSLNGTYFIPVNSSSKFKIYGEFTNDLSGTYDGYLFRFGGGYIAHVMPQMWINLDAYTTYASSDYMKTYFGVNSLQSAASGYALCTPSADIKDIGLSASANWAFNDNWSMLGLLSYKALLGDASSSPIVKDGSSNMFTFGTALVYSF